MANEVGAVYVSIMPTTDGFSRAVTGGISGPLDRAAGKGERSFGMMFRRVAAIGAGILAAVGVGKLVKETISLGVGYNTLEQTSRAAFTTILGSAEAAKTMMAEIKEFGKTSPFPRQAFITATQQMLAFGFAAKDVVPWLGAIQDAVAAAGGSTEDIASIADTLSKVQSTGKLTAQTLNQLGYAGINAAKLIGDQMGMTEAEIRDSITKGTLDAGEALDALRDGMVDTYGGAAGLVKETWVGATDRIKAAWRDISSALMAPFVDPEGGGYAVDWANRFGDVLRGFENSSAFDKLKQKLEDFGDALDPIVNKAADLLQLLLEDGWSSFAEALREVASVNPLWDAMFQVADALAPVLPALIDAIKEVLPSVIEALPALADLVVELLPIVAEVIPGLISALEDSANLISAGISAITEGFDWLWDDAVMDAGIAKRMLDGEFGSIIQAGAQFSADWDAGWVGFWNDFGANWSNFWRNVGNWFRSAWSAVTSAARIGTNTFVNIITGLPGRIQGALSGASSWLVGVGMNIISGLIAGINMMIGSAISAVINAGQAIINSAKSVLGIKSPSTVFRDEIGGNIMAGITEGIKKKLPGVQADMRLALSVPSMAGVGAQGAAPVYVQNPFTGEYLLGRVDARAQGVVAGVGRSRSRGFRG